MRLRALGLIGAIWIGLAASPTANATVIVSLVPSAVTVGLGETFDLEIRADLSEDAIVGFGLDLVFDSVLLQVDTVVLGTGWDAAFAPDGDELAAFAPLEAPQPGRTSFSLPSRSAAAPRATQLWASRLHRAT